MPERQYVYRSGRIVFPGHRGGADSDLSAPRHQYRPKAVTITGTDTYTTPGAGCTIQFIGVQGQNFYSQAQVSGLLFQFNEASAIPGASSNNTASAGLYIDWTGAGDSTTQDIGYSTIQYNTFFDNCSNIDGLTTDEGGTCGGIVVKGSNVNLTVQDNNSSGQIEEFFHTLGQSSTGNSNGSISTNLLVQNNDIAAVHRIAIETQQEKVTNQVIQYNDASNFYSPYGNTTGIPNACCLPTPAGGSASPVPAT